MSDSTRAQENLEATSASGDASGSRMPCVNLRKNGLTLIDGRPVKIVDMSTSKTGSGYKIHIVGIDILTGRKHEVIKKHTEEMEVPTVVYTDYQVASMADGLLHLVAQNGPDVELPAGPFEAEVQAGITEEKALVVKVVAAIGEMQVILVREGVVGDA
ncbi:eukaryotic translation initiation factor 5A [Mycena latifolia]|nr:eukaryotic translation initiation factor 5A [Mycena latifolia]